MLQPCPQMSEMGMGTNGRGGTREPPRGLVDPEREDHAILKEDHSMQASFRKIFSILAPHLALMAVFFLYLIFGAVVFRELEDHHSEANFYETEINRSRSEMQTLMKNMTCSRSARQPPGDALSETNNRGKESFSYSNDDDNDDEMEIDKRISDMINMFNRPDVKAGRIETMQAGRAWGFQSSMLFCMTTITTIGYGDIVPVTNAGRAFCIVYSIVGIPLALLYLASIGNLLARLTLKVCRITHRLVFLKTCVYVSCRKCRRSVKNAPQTSSRKKIVNDDVEIAMDNVNKPPEYSSEDNFGKQGKVNGGEDSLQTEHCVVRSVSIATERPTSFPRGVTKQHSDTTSLPNVPPCSCEPHECRCEHAKPEPDVLEEVPLVVVICILVGYVTGGAALVASSEDWDYLTGVYFMFITLTTIGFGDVLLMDHYKSNTFIPCIFFMLFGLAIMSMCIALVQSKVLRSFQYINKKFGLFEL